MTTDIESPYLLTPGPLTTSSETKQVMLRDWGSRDAAFIRINRELRAHVVSIAGGGDDLTCVPVQGSGTFAVEAMLAGFVPRDGKILLVINGAYGHRMAKICDYLGRDFLIYETPEDTPPDPAAISDRLAVDSKITHVAIVHCETTSGILNPIEASIGFRIPDVVSQWTIATCVILESTARRSEIAAGSGGVSSGVS